MIPTVGQFVYGALVCIGSVGLILTIALLCLSWDVRRRKGP